MSGAQVFDGRRRICEGCGLISPLEELDRHAGICHQCFDRRVRRAGGGPIRVVTSGRTVHRTARCPPVRQSAKWWLTREEDALYARMSGDLADCGRCMWHV